MAEVSRFDELVERRGTNSYKWDVGFDSDVIPMWVADMDFRTAGCIVEALRKRVEHGVFGYTKVPKEYSECVAAWFERRHGWKFDPETLMYTTGVVPALSATIKALTRPGDSVVIATPVYNCFFSSIRNNGCTIVECPLARDGKGFCFDWEALEREFAKPECRVFVHCNPHNPAGRVWSAEEHARIAALASKHGVYVVSDEIHGEFVFNGARFVPYASVDGIDPDTTVILTAASKAFNLAGLQLANIICASAAIRAKIDRAINDNECCDVNPFGVIAVMAAYTDEGEKWLDELLGYIWENAEIVRRTFERELPEIPLAPLQATYLMWADCSAVRIDGEEIERELIETEKVWINAGGHYGRAGEDFVRINLACPRARLEEGLARIVAGLRRLIDRA